MNQVEPWELKQLSPKHRQVVALLAQGVARDTIAELCEFTPEYITWLHRQPVCQAYLKELMQYADARLIALTERSVDAIAETLNIGSEDGRLKAARLQLEAVGRIGRFRAGDEEAPGRGELELLAERLVGLLKTKRGEVYESTSVRTEQSEREVEDATLIAVRSADAGSSQHTP